MDCPLTFVTFALLLTGINAVVKNYTNGTKTVMDEARVVKENVTARMDALADYLSESVKLMRSMEARFLKAYHKDRLRDTNKTQYSSAGSAGGAVFTRWGNSTCSEETELAYHGFATSGHYSHYGAGSNILCSHSEPQFERTYHYNTSKYNYLYGVEYENIWRSELNNHDAPCAVCRSSTRSSAIMVPGRHECMEGWHTEYWGFLVGANAEDQGNVEYICLDSNPEPVEGGFQDLNGRTLYNIKVACGSLPCPPYKANYFVPCAVCTK